MWELKSWYHPKGRHKVRLCEGDTIKWLHWSKSSLLETKGYSGNNFKTYRAWVATWKVKEWVTHGIRCYIDMDELYNWVWVGKPKEEKIVVEKPMEEKISEEKIINKPEPVGKPKDAMEFIKQFKQQQWESVDDFLAEMDRTSNLPYKMNYIGKKFGANKVYEITFKESGKTIYWIEAKKYWEDVFIKIEVNDDGQMYQDCYVDQYGEKIE